MAEFETIVNDGGQALPDSQAEPDLHKLIDSLLILDAYPHQTFLSVSIRKVRVIRVLFFLTG